MRNIQEGTGLSFIMEQALQYKRSNRKSGVMVNGKLEDYDDTLPHRNIVISDTLQVIENVILFSISNYFLRFSSEYKRFHQLESFQNDWYEIGSDLGTKRPKLVQPTLTHSHQLEKITPTVL